MLGTGGDYLERQVRKLEKDRASDPAVKMIQLRKLFSSCTKNVPSPLLEEFFLQLLERHSYDSSGNGLFLDIMYAAADLFSLDYDDREDLLDKEEWKLVGELVSDYGADIDDNTLTYVMSRVVDHGAL